MSQELYNRQELNSKVAAVESILASAICRLYTATGAVWKYSDIVGVVTLILNRKTQAHSFRVYSLKGFTKRFECEIPFDLDYIELTSYFHCFELENCLIGFSFADETKQRRQQEEAASADGTRSRRDTISKLTNAKLFYDKVLRNRPKKLLDDNNKQKTLKKRISNKLMKSFKKYSSRRNSGKFEIGEVTEVKHVHHVGVNADGGFDFTRIPDEWKHVLKASGLSKKEFINNKEKQKVALDFLATTLPLSEIEEKEEMGNPQRLPTHLESPPKKTDYQKSIPQTPSTMTAVAKQQPHLQQQQRQQDYGSLPPIYLQAKYSFSALNNDQLSIDANDVLSLIENFIDGWAMVIHEKTKHHGLVPFLYCSVINDHVHKSSSSHEKISVYDLKPKPLPQPSISMRATPQKTPQQLRQQEAMHAKLKEAKSKLPAPPLPQQRKTGTTTGASAAATHPIPSRNIAQKTNQEVNVDVNSAPKPPSIPVRSKIQIKAEPPIPSQRPQQQSQSKPQPQAQETRPSAQKQPPPLPQNGAGYSGGAPPTQTQQASSETQSPPLPSTDTPVASEKTPEQVVTAPVQVQQQVAAENHKPKPSFLSAISGFDKAKLGKAPLRQEQEVKASPGAANPLLASISGFAKTGLRKVDNQAVLREKMEFQSSQASVVNPNSLGDILKAKLANVRTFIDDDDYDSGSESSDGGWDD